MSSAVTPMSWNTPTTTPNPCIPAIPTPKELSSTSPADVNRVAKKPVLTNDTYTSSRNTKSRVSLQNIFLL